MDKNIALHKYNNKEIIAVIIFSVAIILLLLLVDFVFPTKEPVMEENISRNDIIISEVMSSNKDALAWSDGRFYDWVEVYNPTAEPINVSGYALSDDSNEPTKFIFPNITIGSNSYAIIYLSNNNIIDDMHGNFKISSSGESIYLFNNNINIIDSVYVEHLDTNETYARDPQDLSKWVIMENFTPNYPNDNEGWDAFQEARISLGSNLMINEIMSSNIITIADVDGEYSDWVEIVNLGDEPINLKGYSLSNSPTKLKKWIFPEIWLQEDKYLLVFLSGKDKFDDSNDELHANFRLNSINDILLLSNSYGSVIDKWEIPELGSDLSMGRIYDNNNEFNIFTHPSPRYKNDESGYNEFTKTNAKNENESIIINEVMLGNSKTFADTFGEYNDWIEIYNKSSQPILLSDYYLSDNTSQFSKWQFPKDVYIQPKEYIVIFASGVDNYISNEMHTNFSINSSGEPIILSDKDGNIIDKCILTSMPYDMSYGRSSNSATYQYMKIPSPGQVNGAGWNSFAQEPQMLQLGGIYAPGTIISINAKNNSKVYYSTDSSIPNQNSKLYTGAFMINESVVIRAIVYEDNKLPSNIITHTYFININHSLPVVSIIADPVNLFSDLKGIYAFGESFNKTAIPFRGANFNQEWEIAANIEMFDIDGSTTLSQPIGLKIFGAYSRAEIKKSFAIIAREQYGEDKLNYPIFPDRAYASYKSVVLRSGASEWFSSMIRDALLTSLVRDTTELDVQSFNPVVLYINGKYWGVYFFREKINKYYLQQHYGMNPENVDIIYGNGTSSNNALAGDNSNWLSLKEFVTNNDMSNDEVYNKVNTWVDIDSFMDMIINEIYCGNQDTGNIKAYRQRTPEAKWRWFYYDVDWGFFYSIGADVTKNNLIQYLNTKGHGANDAFETWLIMGLLENKKFKEKFIERFAYHINKTYEPKRVIQRINDIYSIIDSDMEQDRTHWDKQYNKMPQWYKTLANRSMSYKSWSTVQKERLINYANQRPEIMKSQLSDYFGISKAQMNLLFDD